MPTTGASAALADRVLPLIRTRAEVYRRSVANGHGRQMHLAIDTLEAAPDDPSVIFGVTQRAIASATKVIARADDSSGIIGDACRRLLALHARLAAPAHPAPTKLIDWMIDFQFHGNVDYFEIDPAAYASALGDIGLARYRRRLEEIAAGLGPRPRDLWESPHSHAWFVIEWNEKRLAVHDRDVPAIIRTHARDRGATAWFQQTAKALAEIGEFDLAIDWARQAAEFDDGYPSRAAAEYWCRLLTENRPDDLLAARQRVFERWPNATTAARLKDSAGGTWPDLVEGVFARLANDPRSSVEFALGIDVTQAWQLAHELGLTAPDVWLRLSDAYEPIDPTAVLPVIADVVRSMLEEADAGNYRAAAGELVRMRRIAAGTDHAADVDAIVAELREQFRRRPRLQTEFTRAGLP